MSRKSRYYEDYEYHDDNYEDEQRGGKQPFRPKETKVDKRKFNNHNDEWSDDYDDYDDRR